MATYNANKHGVRFSVTGNLANKLASLTDAGPLMVHKENWLAVLGAAILPPPGTNNLVPISYYVIEDILSAAWIKTLELRQHPMGYTITVDSVGQMLADLDAKGMSWDPASSIHEMRLRATRTALTLPASDRALDVSDINPFGATTGTPTQNRAMIGHHIFRLHPEIVHPSCSSCKKSGQADRANVVWHRVCQRPVFATTSTSE